MRKALVCKMLDFYKNKFKTRFNKVKNTVLIKENIPSPPNHYSYTRFHIHPTARVLISVFYRR